MIYIYDLCWFMLIYLFFQRIIPPNLTTVTNAGTVHWPWHPPCSGHDAALATPRWLSSCRTTEERWRKLSMETHGNYQETNHSYMRLYIYTKNMCSYHAWYIRAMDSLAKKSNVTYHKAGFPFRSTRPKTPATFRTRVRAFRMGRLCPTCVRPRCSFQRFWGTSGRQDATWHHIIQQGVPLLYSWKCRWNSIFQKYFHILNWIKDRTIKS